MLNHQYEQNVMGVTSRKSTGGEWVSLLPTIRLQFSLVGHEKIDDEEVAQLTEVKVVKNDFGSRKKTVIRILLGYGIILSQPDIDYAVERGILKKVGIRKLSFANGKLSWSSNRELFQHYYDHNPLLALLEKSVNAARSKDLQEWRKRMFELAEEAEEE